MFLSSSYTDRRDRGVIEMKQITRLQDLEGKTIKSATSHYFDIALKFIDETYCMITTDCSDNKQLSDEIGHITKHELGIISLEECNRLDKQEQDRRDAIKLIHYREKIESMLNECPELKGFTDWNLTDIPSKEVLKSGLEK